MGIGRGPLVPPGTKGIYDANPTIRSQTARAMVARRQLVDVQCKAEGCIDPATGEARWFKSRLINGMPERNGCTPTHRMRVWRAEMRDKGYRQVTLDGVLGWMTPDNTFHPMPSQPRKRERGARVYGERGTVGVLEGAEDVGA